MGLSRPPIERLMEKVEKRENGCWEWTHYVERNGYARIWVDRRNVGAHRFSYEYHKGPIPEGLQIDHLCNNRRCVNPGHLEAVTPQENCRRIERPEPYQKAWTHCPNGHPYDEENTRVTDEGRSCLTCKRQANKDWYARNRELTIQRAAEWRLANLERSREIARETARRQRAKKKEVA